MKNIKKLNWKWKILPFISLLFLITSCAKREVKKGQITITVAGGYTVTDEGWRIIGESLKKYERLNPDIKIRTNWIAGQNYYGKILTMIAGGTPPDIFRIKPNMVTQFIQKGILLPLDDYIKESKVLSLGNFFPQVLHKYRFDGKEIGKGPVYGFGTDWSPDFALFYNKSLFDKAGLPYPKKSLSWKEYLDIAKKLTIRDKRGRAKQFGTLLPPLELLVYQNGGKIFSEDGKRCLLDSPEAIEAIQFLYDLRNKYRVAPSLGEAVTSDIFTLFQTGRLATFFSGRYLVPNIDKVVGKRFSWSVGPSLHKKKRANMIIGPCGWVISKKTKHPEESYKLLEYLVSGEGEIDLAEIGYNIPVIKKIAYSDTFLNNPNHPEGINKLFLDEVKYAIPSPLTPYAPTDRWEGIIGDEMELVYLEKKSPEEAGKDMAEKINNLLSSFQTQ